jgi:HEPN domain
MIPVLPLALSPKSPFWIQNISMDRFTSMGIWKDAGEFLEAARIVREQKPMTFTFKPLYFLACQSIELSLKAYLRGCGHSDGDLRKIGHDLVKCANAAIKADVEQHILLSDEDVNAITLANPHYHSRDFQYSHTGFKTWPHVDHLINLAQRLSEKLRKFCIENRERHCGKPTAII